MPNITNVANLIAQGVINSNGIRAMHSSNMGAEVLRLIVRDNINGAGDIIADALM